MKKIKLNRMIKVLPLTLTILWLVGIQFGLVAQNNVTIISPDSSSNATLEISNGDLYWSVQYQGKQVLQKSKLGIELEKNVLQKPFKGVNIHTHSKDTTWIPVWGKHSKIRNNYNEIVWSVQEAGALKRTLDIIVRAYNDGIALRYRLNGEGTVVLNDDLTHFSFPEDFRCWSANEWRPNLETINLPDFIGPVPISKFKGFSFPVTVEVAEDCYVAILEAGIYNIAKMLPASANTTTIKSTHKPSSVGLPCETSWRVVQLGKSPGDLLTSNILVNLNPQSKWEDSSWIKPGLSLWDWRVWGSVAKDGFVYGLDMPSWKRQIDFASKYKIPYLMLDAGWYGLEFDPKSDPTTSRKKLLIQPDSDKPQLKYVDPPENWEDPVNVPELIQYGNERNVGIILYLNDIIRKNYDMEETLKTYNKWGASGIKYGFMEGDGQFKVNRTREIVELCGKYKLICNFHDELVLPSGDRRTNPHYLSREFCHSQADGLQSFTPGTFCTTVFTNMLSGPLDMCNGFLTLTNIEKTRPKVFKVIHSTVVAEAARVLIVFAGFAVLPDSPDSYEGKADLFEFIAKLPMNWDETKILNGAVGNYITTARRSGDEWFVASACDEDGVNLDIELDFLDDGDEYEATLYEDAPDSHYITNKDEYRIRKMKVKKGDIIKSKLAPGGGHCIWIKKN